MLTVSNLNRLAGLAALFLALIGCNPGQNSSDSEAKSLDNLVNKAEGSSQEEHSCGVPYTKLSELPEHVRIMQRMKRVKGSAAMKKEVLGTLVAAPVDLIRPFTLLGGVIEVKKTEAAAIAACAGSPLTALEKSLLAGADVNACWVVDKHARIILPPDAKVIRKETLRQLSFFFTEYFVDLGSQEKVPFNDAKVKSQLTAVEQVRNKLEAAFFADIKSMDPDTHKKITAAIEQSRRADLVYAEAIDSYYCSASTDEGSSRAIFKAKFPTAWKVFTDKDNEHSPVRLFGE